MSFLRHKTEEPEEPEVEIKPVVIPEQSPLVWQTENYQEGRFLVAIRKKDVRYIDGKPAFKTPVTEVPYGTRILEEGMVLVHDLVTGRIQERSGGPYDTEAVYSIPAKYIDSEGRSTWFNSDLEREPVFVEDDDTITYSAALMTDLFKNGWYVLDFVGEGPLEEKQTFYNVYGEETGHVDPHITILRKPWEEE